MAVARAVEGAEHGLNGCRSVDVDLGHLDRIDGTGAALLARFFERLDAAGQRTNVAESSNPEAAQLIALYRTRQMQGPVAHPPPSGTLARIGASAAGLVGSVGYAL